MTDFIAPPLLSASVIFNFVFENYLKVVAKLHISIFNAFCIELQSLKYLDFLNQFSSNRIKDFSSDKKNLLKKTNISFSVFLK